MIVADDDAGAAGDHAGCCRRRVDVADAEVEPAKDEVDAAGAEVGVGGYEVEAAGDQVGVAGNEVKTDRSRVEPDGR
jgi:hypothetical protein